MRHAPTCHRPEPVPRVVALPTEPGAFRWGLVALECPACRALDAEAVDNRPEEAARAH